MFGINKEQNEGSCDGLGLETLFPPPNASDLDAVVDIVFVHGLGGKRYHTWTKNDILWPRDLLAKDFPKARIMTWGYDANVMKFLGPTGQSNVRDHAKALNFDLCQARKGDHQRDRPMIFVAHSLGGLVVKKALVISYREGVKQTVLAIDHRLAALKACTKGILFAGTPHRGSNMAKWICTATKFASLVQSDRNPELITMLKRGSERLDDIHDDFKDIVEHFAVYSLLEEVPFPRIGKIVERESALLGFGCHETEVLIHANHRDMVKFASRTDNNYVKVRNVIGDIIGDRIDGAVGEGNGSPRITRSRTWCTPADRPARDASRPKLTGLNSLPPNVSASLSDFGHTSGSNEWFTERSNTTGISEDEFVSALKQGSYYFRQTNKNNPRNLEAADYHFTTAYKIIKISTNPNPAALVEILLEMVQVRTEMSYQRRLSPQQKYTHIKGARAFAEQAREYALCSEVVGHLALVDLHVAILLGREAEVYRKLGKSKVDVRRKKEMALRDVGVALEALTDSGQVDMDMERYRKWADEWRGRLGRI